MSRLTIEASSFTTESAPLMRLADVRIVTKPKKLTPGEKRMVKECDRIVADPRTTWHSWSDVKKQLGL